MDGQGPYRLSELEASDSQCPQLAIADDRLVVAWQAQPHDRSARPALYAAALDASGYWEQRPVPNTAGAWCPNRIVDYHGAVIQFEYEGRSDGPWFVWWAGAYGGHFGLPTAGFPAIHLAFQPVL